MVPDRILTIRNENFDELVIKSATPVLLDFWAIWCSPCKAIEPILNELAEEFEERFKIGKINVDKEDELVKNFDIMNIPTLIIFNEGVQVEKVVGVRSKADLKLLMDKYI